MQNKANNTENVKASQKRGFLFCHRFRDILFNIMLIILDKCLKKLNKKGRKFIAKTKMMLTFANV